MLLFNNMNKIDITIISICRNNPEELEKTLNNIFRFNAIYFECIVVDGSTNNECKDISNNYNMHYIAQSGKGIYNAMNEGAKVANGRSVIFMNSGDCFHEQFDLALFVKKHTQDLDKKIIFGNTELYYKNHNRFNTFKGYNFDKQWWLNRLPCHQSIFCPASYLKSNLLSENLNYSSDTLFLKKAFHINEHVYYPNLISRFELGGVSSRPVNVKQTIKHCSEVILVNKIQGNMNKASLYSKQLIKLLIIKVIGYSS